MTNSPELIDWRGNRYTVGTRVIYAAMSGRSVELQEATVLDIIKSYKDTNDYKWKRYELDEAVPFKQVWDRELQRYVDSEERSETKISVKLQPEGRGSRDFHMRTDSVRTYVNEHTGEEVDWTYIDKHYYEPAAIEHWKRTGSRIGTNYAKVSEKMAEDGWERKETPIKPRPVTLHVIDNITVI
jgi:hypothetical protein